MTLNPSSLFGRVTDRTNYTLEYYFNKGRQSIIRNYPNIYDGSPCSKLCFFIWERSQVHSVVLSRIIYCLGLLAFRFLLLPLRLDRGQKISPKRPWRDRPTLQSASGGHRGGGLSFGNFPPSGRSWAVDAASPSLSGIITNSTIINTAVHIQVHIMIVSSNGEPCFWRDISSRVEESSKLLIVVDNAKSHKVREAASVALGMTSTHSRSVGPCGIVSPPWSSPRMSNRWETSSSSAKAASPQSTGSCTSSSNHSHNSSSPSNNECGSESSDSDFYDEEGNSILVDSSSGVAVAHVPGLLSKAPQDTRLRLPTRKISNPVPERMASIDRPVLTQANGDPSSKVDPLDAHAYTDTTLKLPKRKPSDEPSKRMTTVLESKAMADIVVDRLIDLPNRPPERKVSEVSTTSTASWSSSGRPPIPSKSSSSPELASLVEDLSSLWVVPPSVKPSGTVKRKGQTGPRLPVRRESIDVDGPFLSKDGDDDQEEVEAATTKPTIPSSVQIGMARTMSTSSTASSTTSMDKETKKKHLDKMIDAMLDEFERNPTALIEQALASREVARRTSNNSK
jgi:hypothetical protein